MVGSLLDIEVKIFLVRTGRWWGEDGVEFGSRRSHKGNWNVQFLGQNTALVESWTMTGPPMGLSIGDDWITHGPKERDSSPEALGDNPVQPVSGTPPWRPITIHHLCFGIPMWGLSREETLVLARQQPDLWLSSRLGFFQASVTWELAEEHTAAIRMKGDLCWVWGRFQPGQFFLFYRRCRGDGEVPCEEAQGM